MRSCPLPRDFISLEKPPICKTDGFAQETTNETLGEWFLTPCDVGGFCNHDLSAETGR